MPTRVNLDTRGTDLDSFRCPKCDEDIGNEEHVLLSTLRQKVRSLHLAGSSKAAGNEQYCLSNATFIHILYKKRKKKKKTFICD